ncbi:MAG: hypothetical protein HOO06_14155 [Bdellovibrionaceae bacterium]|jgi:hypothetical protein|nr:hypothetical protein [Pseudobdellovibrionaceae bacterium]
MNLLLALVLIPTFLVSCASKPASESTKPNSIVFNPTSDLGDCKYLGVVESEVGDDWKKNMRSTAGDKGATHLLTSGPNGVSGSDEKELVTASVYFCKSKTLK